MNAVTYVVVLGFVSNRTFYPSPLRASAWRRSLATCEPSGRKWSLTRHLQPRLFNTDEMV